METSCPGANGSGAPNLQPSARSHSRPRHRKNTGRQIPAQARKARVQGRPRAAGSKQDKIVALLQRPQGATLAKVVKATGWQAHSVRGFFAGTLRKKLGLKLVSTVADGVRVYRIAAARRTRR